MLFDVKDLVDKTIEFVHALLENFETAEEVLRDSTRVVIVIVLAYWGWRAFMAIHTGI